MSYSALRSRTSIALASPAQKYTFIKKRSSHDSSLSHPLLSGPATISPFSDKKYPHPPLLAETTNRRTKKADWAGFCSVLCLVLFPRVGVPGRPTIPKRYRSCLCRIVSSIHSIASVCNTRCFVQYFCINSNTRDMQALDAVFLCLFFFVFFSFCFFFPLARLFFLFPAIRLSVFRYSSFSPSGFFSFSYSVVPFSPLSALRLGQARYQKSRCTRVRQRQLKRPRQTRRTGQNMHRLYAGWCADTLGRMSADIRFYQPFRPFFVLRPGCQDARMPGCQDAMTPVAHVNKSFLRIIVTMSYYGVDRRAGRAFLADPRYLLPSLRLHGLSPVAHPPPWRSATQWRGARLRAVNASSRCRVDMRRKRKKLDRRVNK